MVKVKGKMLTKQRGKLKPKYRIYKSGEKTKTKYYC